jgi:hypothetical protein
MSDEVGKDGTDAPLEGDKSQKGDGGWKPPSDGSWLPKIRVDEMVNEAKGAAARAAGEAAELRARLTALEAEKAKPQEAKPISRAELKQLVEDGKITQDAADAHWEAQVVKTAEAKARAAAADEVQGQQRESVVTQQLEEYRTLMPSAWEVGAKERAKVEREFKALRKLGFPDNKVTEVAALRAAFGDPDVIRASRSTGKNGPGDTFVEVGGGDRPADGGADADGAPKGLTEREKTHYQNLINRGVVRDWKAVAEERKFAKAKQA